MDKTSLLLKIAGTVFIVGPVIALINLFVNSGFMIPYYNLGSMIACCVLACIAGSMNKKFLIVAGTVIFFAVHVALIIMNIFHAISGVYYILFFIDLGAMPAGVIILAIDTFKGSQKGLGSLLIVTIVLLATWYPVLGFLNMNTYSTGGQFYFLTMPIDQAIWMVIDKIPWAMQDSAFILLSVFYIVREPAKDLMKIEQKPAVSSMDAQNFM